MLGHEPHPFAPPRSAARRWAHVSCTATLLIPLLALASLACHPIERDDDVGDSVTDHRVGELINLHREELGLARIPYDAALVELAETHVHDLDLHPPLEPCSLHSWSTDGRWTPCCYRRDQPDVSCMTVKPREVAGFPGIGYEIAVEYDGVMPLDGERALALWLESAAHRAVIENQGEWADRDWDALGAASTATHAVAWFGILDD